MASDDLLSVLPLIIASLVPASLFAAAFLISRQRSRFLTVAAVVTTLAAGLAYLAVALRALLYVVDVLGYVPNTTRHASSCSTMASCSARIIQSTKRRSATS